MTQLIAFPEGMEYRQALKITDAIMLSDTENPDKGQPEYTYLEDIRTWLTYKAKENENGFLTGLDLKKINTALSQLSLGDISNTNSAYDFTGTLTDLFIVEKYDSLIYNCLRVNVWTEDCPPELRDTDKYCYVFTNRNSNNGIQVVIGETSGYQFSRSKLGETISPWNSIRGDEIYYATFDVNTETGELEMHTNPGYTGADFSIESDNLIVTI